MKKTTRIVIVAALLIAAAGVLALKNHSSSGRPDAAAASPARLPRLVDLGASKCIPCKMMAPILDQLSQDYAGRLEVTFIDVWENPRAGEEHRVRMIPTQIFFDAQGKELF
ncbi:MAG: thioredoxin family protein, partial [Phycisphaeraceae bacterium]|nr:thioredoxin family protein [Phycisphaeraceae bacterium]